MLAVRAPLHVKAAAQTFGQVSESRRIRADGGRDRAVAVDSFARPPVRSKMRSIGRRPTTPVCARLAVFTTSRACLGETASPAAVRQKPIKWEIPRNLTKSQRTKVPAMRPPQVPVPSKLSQLLPGIAPQSAAALALNIGQPVRRALARSPGESSDEGDASMPTNQGADPC